MACTPRSCAHRVLHAVERVLRIRGTWGHSRRWEWRLAWVVDLVHWPAVAFVVTGALWLPATVYAVLFGLVTVAQFELLGSPIAAASERLRQRAKAAKPAGSRSCCCRRR